MKFQGIILKLFNLLIFVSCAFGSNKKFKSHFLDIQQIRKEISILQKSIFDLPKAVIQSNNWTGNHDCFIELNAIENGIRNFDEWAMESMLAALLP